VGDIVAVGAGEAATFALLLARFAGSVTHPVASRQAAMKSADPKYCFILCTLPLVSYAGLLGNACAVQPNPCAFCFSSRLCAKQLALISNPPSLWTISERCSGDFRSDSGLESLRFYFRSSG
jgi:hypothetical protein